MASRSLSWLSATVAKLGIELVEAVGFEPTKPFGLAAFWATGINHSPTLPHGCQMPTIAIQALVGRHEHWHPLSRIIRIVAVGVAQLAAQLAFFGFHNPARQCRLPTWWRERDSNSRYLSVRRVSSAMPSATRPSLQFGAGEGIRTLKKPILRRLRLPFRHARFKQKPSPASARVKAQ